MRADPASSAAGVLLGDHAEAPTQPRCGPGQWQEKDVWNRRADASCRAPEYCSADYWLGIRAFAQAAGAPPTAHSVSEAACVIRTGRAFRAWVTVTPEGSEPFVALVEGWPSVVVPDPTGREFGVEVSGALRFYGRARFQSFGVRAGLLLAGGRVRTGSRTRAAFLSIQGNQALADLTLTETLTARSATLPCAMLAATAEPEPPAQLMQDPRATALLDGPIPLFVSAKAGSAIELISPFAHAFEQQGARTRIEISTDDHALVRGWIPSAALTGGGGGGMGYGIGGSACGCRPRGNAEVRVVIPAATEVFSAPGLGRWAIFSRAVEVDAEEVDSSWLRLVRLAGLSETYSLVGSSCADLSHEYVRRADVRVVATTP